jgi:hypothetical protein
VWGKDTVTGISLVRQKIKRHDLSLTIFRTRKLRRGVFYYFLHYGAYGSIQQGEVSDNNDMDGLEEFLEFRGLLQWRMASIPGEISIPMSLGSCSSGSGGW